MVNKELIKIVGSALLLSSQIFALGSVEMSSKFSVINFSKDQKTLDKARDALSSFINVAAVWMVATISTLYATHGYCGAAFALLFNVIITGSIILSYFKSFEQAAKEYNLQYPETYTRRTWYIIIASLIVLQLYFFYKCGYLGFLEKSSSFMDI